MNKIINTKDMEIKVEKHNKIIIFKLIGGFNLEEIKSVEDVWNKQISKAPETIAFDCSELKTIDSSAIGTLVKFLNNSQKYDVDLVFFDLKPTILRVFEITKLNALFSITSKEKFFNRFNIKE